MARKYRRIDPRIWGDERFRGLDTDCKLLAFYCLTSPQGNRIGLFRFSLSLAAEDLESLPQTLRERFFKVIETLKWRFDEEAKVLFLPTWWKYNVPENPNVLISCLDDLHDVPATPLLVEFCDNVSYLPPKFLQPFGKVTAKVTANLRPTYQSGTGAGTGAGTGEEDRALPPWDSVRFGMAWACYPEQGRTKREAAIAAWQVAIQRLQYRTDGPADSQEFLIDRVKAFAASPKGRGKFVPSIANWLDEGRYDDAPAAWQDSDQAPARTNDAPMAQGPPKRSIAKVLPQ